MSRAIAAAYSSSFCPRTRSDSERLMTAPLSRDAVAPADIMVLAALWFYGTSHRWRYNGVHSSKAPLSAHSSPPRFYKSQADLYIIPLSESAKLAFDRTRSQAVGVFSLSVRTHSVSARLVTLAP
ncbi:hypothetical protein E4T56_gene11547 [Termitomyces sp. T112]|nr:hypothetical protein E4T56_gene11547 [Termitomyces sp. T112]